MRLRQIRNLLATLLLSRGVPMLLGGDEFRRTQAGNNNAYCQDNAISWYDWSLAERNGELVQFVRRLIALRNAHSVLRAETFYTDGEVSWFGPAGNAPDWQGSDNRFGCLVRDRDAALCLLFNAAPVRCRFIMPAPPGSGWQVVIDTSKEDLTADTSPGTEHRVNAAYEIWLEARSTIVAICRSMEV